MTLNYYQGISTLTPKTHRAWVEVNLSNLRHNIKSLLNTIGDTKLMGIVKANGYGHSSVEVAKVLLEYGVGYFGVATLEEAMELRQNGISAPILLLGPTPPYQKEIVEQDIGITVFNETAIMEWANALAKHHPELKKPINTHLKVDTGMRRLGCEPDEVGYLSNLITSNPLLNLASFYSHLATADNDRDFAIHQKKLFDKAIGELKLNGRDEPLYHIANSAGVILGNEFHYDMVRTGLAMYGIDPTETSSLDFKPVLALKSRIANVKHITKGESVSYSRNFIAKRESKIAIISIGYADGLPRSLSNKAHVLVRGKTAPIIGNITMDQAIIDITDIDDITLGDEVVLIGSQSDKAGKTSTITASDWADMLSTIPYEVVCIFKVRLPRVFV